MQRTRRVRRRSGRRGARAPAGLGLVLLVVLGCGNALPDSRDAAPDPIGDAVADAPGDTPADAAVDAMGDTSRDAISDAPSDAANPPDPGGIDVPGCLSPDTEGATSRCLQPRQAPEYYVDQGLRYFDTLDIGADPARVPAYSQRVARWEWPPWLKLTGYEREPMVQIGDLLRQFDPSTVPVRDCRAFAVQPFGRCHVVMEYDGAPCPIYEEFTFNDQGEMTFIEAWSDAPGLLPTPDPADPWAEGETVHRLSTRIPGLGNATGRIDLDSAPMAQAAAADPEIADFLARARDFWETWYAEYQAAGDDLFQRGCGW